MDSNADPRRIIDCHYFLTSECKKGESCPFRHKESLKMTNKICKYFKNGSCQKGYDCEYRHPDPSMPTPKSELVCWYYNNGGCASGENCLHKHIKEEPKTKKSNILSRLSSKSKTKNSENPAEENNINKLSPTKDINETASNTNNKSDPTEKSVKKDESALSVFDRLKPVQKEEDTGLKRKRSEEVEESSNKAQKVFENDSEDINLNTTPETIENNDNAQNSDIPENIENEETNMTSEVEEPNNEDYNEPTYDEEQNEEIEEAEEIAEDEQLIENEEGEEIAEEKIISEDTSHDNHLNEPIYEEQSQDNLVTIEVSNINDAFENESFEGNNEITNGSSNEKFVDYVENSMDKELDVEENQLNLNFDDRSQYNENSNNEQIIVEGNQDICTLEEQDTNDSDIIISEIDINSEEQVIQEENKPNVTVEEEEQEETSKVTEDTNVDSESIVVTEAEIIEERHIEPQIQVIEEENALQEESIVTKSDLESAETEHETSVSNEYPPCMNVFKELGLTIDYLNDFPDDMKNAILNSVSKEEILEIISNCV